MIKLLDILLEEKQEKYHILKQLRSPEERKKNYIIATQQKIQQYIKDGSKGDLELINTPIISLPNNLTVSGNLYLTNTPIKSLPDDLKVGGNLFLRSTPLSQTHTKGQIIQMAPGVKGNIYIHIAYQT